MCYLPLIYSQEVSAFAALALGLVFTSSCKEEIVMAILQVCNCAVCAGGGGGADIYRLL